MTTKMDEALQRMRGATVAKATPLPTPPVEKEPAKSAPTSSPPERKPFVSVHTDVLSASEARKYAEKKVNELGVPMPGCPTSHPDIQLPDDITAIPTEHLGKLLGKYTAFSAYLEGQVALLGVDSHCAEQTLEYVRNRVLLSAEVQMEYDKAAEKKAATDTFNDVVKLNAQVSKVSAEFDTVSALLRAYEKLANAVSREISRRGSIAHLESSGRIS